MTAQDDTGKRVPTEGDMTKAHADRCRAEIERLGNEAKKRFWELYFDESLRWYGIKDHVGRIVCSPRPESQLRGFFAGLPPQA